VLQLADEKAITLLIFFSWIDTSRVSNTLSPYLIIILLLSSNTTNFKWNFSVTGSAFCFPSVKSIIYGILQHYFLLLLTFIIMIKNSQLLNIWIDYSFFMLMANYTPKDWYFETINILLVLNKCYRNYRNASRHYVECYPDRRRLNPQQIINIERRSHQNPFQRRR